MAKWPCVATFLLHHRCKWLHPGGPPLSRCFFGRFFSGQNDFSMTKNCLPNSRHGNKKECFHGKKEQVTDNDKLYCFFSKRISSISKNMKFLRCILIKKSPNLLRLLSINRDADASIVFGVIFLS